MTRKVDTLSPELQAIATGSTPEFVDKIVEIAEKKLCLGCFDFEPLDEDRNEGWPTLPGIAPMHGWCTEFLSCLFYETLKKIDAKTSDESKRNKAIAYTNAAVVKVTASSFRKAVSDRTDNNPRSNIGGISIPTPEDSQMDNGMKPVIEIFQNQGWGAAEAYLNGGDSAALKYLQSLKPLL